MKAQKILMIAAVAMGLVLYSGFSESHGRLGWLLAWNCAGVVMAGLVALIGWERWLKAAPFVFAGWVAVLLGAHMQPMVNGAYSYLRIGPVAIEVWALFPIALALLTVWVAKRYGGWVVLAAYLFVVAFLCVKVLVNVNRREYVFGELKHLLYLFTSGAPSAVATGFVLFLVASCIAWLYRLSNNREARLFMLIWGALQSLRALFADIVGCTSVLMTWMGAGLLTAIYIEWKGSMKRIIIGMLGIAGVGCAIAYVAITGTTEGYDGGKNDLHIHDDDVLDIYRCHRRIRLSKIFGIDEEMLADTNRFPVSSRRWYEFDLPEGMAGFEAVRFSLMDDNGKFGLFCAEMQKELPPESDDVELYKEFKSAVDMVGKVLGIELKCPKIGDVGTRVYSMARTLGDLRMQRLHLPSSNLRIKLADGYAINIEANDAVYVKRNGKLCLAANAFVEVDIRGDDGVRMRRRMAGGNDSPTAVTREVDFGVDLSRQLSEATKDAAAGRSNNMRSAGAIKRMAKEAEPGNVKSMLALADAYHYGLYVKEDQELAFKYYKMAADAGDARGVSKLAFCYENGQGTEKDVVKAAELWRKAAEMGDASAVPKYANCLAEGIVVEQDPKQAAELFLRFASQSEADPRSIVQIASFYLRGFGVEKDEAKAREWLGKLEARAQDGDLSAISVLFEFYLDDKKGGKDAARAYKMAQLAEKTNTMMGYEAMARCYREGIGVEKDAAKAKEYIEKAIGSRMVDGRSEKLKKTLKKLEEEFDKCAVERSKRDMEQRHESSSPERLRPRARK